MRVVCAAGNNVVFSGGVNDNRDFPSHVVQARWRTCSAAQVEPALSRS